MKRISFSRIIMYASIALFSLFCFLPMLLTLAISLTEEDVIKKNGYSFWPEKFSAYAYKLIFHGGSSVLNAYMISIFVTVAGTILAVAITTMAAYTLSNKAVLFRNSIAMYFFITMVFSSGLVPWYLVCRNLHLTNNILSLIVPNLLFNPFNLFLVRNFMQGIPESLKESAQIDGANDAVVAFRIIIPLCTPVLATVSLFYGLAYWNDWFNAIMLVDNNKLYPLQYMLFTLQSQINMVNQLMALSGQSQSITPPTESVRMATAIITVGPIVFLYPYLQKYFIKGLIIGSVKG